VVVENIVERARVFDKRKLRVGGACAVGVKSERFARCHTDGSAFALDI
jgi:hypothetical protein